MANFPSIQLPSSRKRTVSKPQLKHEFEAGYNQIRAKGTRSKRKWTLSWDFLPKSDWELLISHFTSNSGDSFIIAKEMLYESTNYTVIYSIDEITANSTKVKEHYAVEVQVEEL